MRGMGGGMHFGAVGGGARFSGARFAGARFAHASFTPGFSRAAFRPGFHHGSFHHRFFHHRFNRFVFVGAPFAYGAYAAYDGCWSRVWTPYGLQWVNVCGDYYGY